MERLRSPAEADPDPAGSLRRNAPPLSIPSLVPTMTMGPRAERGPNASQLQRGNPQGHSMTPFLISALVLFVPSDPPGGEEAEKGFRLSDLVQKMGDSGVLDSMRVGGLLRAAYDLADDELSDTAGEDIQGLRIYDAQLWFSAELEGYEVFVKLDAGETTAFPPIGVNDDGVTTVDLRDAFVRKAIGEYLHVYVGQYKCPFIMSANVGDDSLAMIDRTRLGFLFAFPGAYQPGVALVGDYENFHVKVSVQNGADKSADGKGIVARAEYQVNAGGKYREGALGSDGFNGTFGIGYFKDDSDIAGSDFG